ncbi:hypothetical protein BE21_57600 [Sorangium cellulosum]|uniref:Uncharacterized protein n=1 Tax=Sorangium cellulosum TaxID=56 RepID=A0A150U3S6_SORCE|nr:hypothetical protein BE21_57600 [Sorangium cellulosum]
MSGKLGQATVAYNVLTKLGKLNTSERSILFALMGFIDWKTGTTRENCHPSRSELAEEAGFAKVDTIDKHMASLVAKGLVVKIHRTRMNAAGAIEKDKNAYRLRVPVDEAGCVLGHDRRRFEMQDDETDAPASGIVPAPAPELAEAPAPRLVAESAPTAEKPQEAPAAPLKVYHDERGRPRTGPPMKTPAELFEGGASQTQDEAATMPELEDVVQGWLGSIETDAIDSHVAGNLAQLAEDLDVVRPIAKKAAEEALTTDDLLAALRSCEDELADAIPDGRRTNPRDLKKAVLSVAIPRVQSVSSYEGAGYVGAGKKARLAAYEATKGDPALMRLYLSAEPIGSAQAPGGAHGATTALVYGVAVGNDFVPPVAEPKVVNYDNDCPF